MTSSPVVNRANKATTKQLESSILSSTVLNGVRFNLAVKSASELSHVDRERVWNIFESNMRLLYKTSSFGWDPLSKKEEIFHPLARLVLCERSELSQIVAYTIIRFEREAQQDVVYCYELQVTEESRRLGLGNLLTSALSDIGFQWGMKRVMLTVFKANTAALAFYKSMGFDLDPTSPRPSSYGLPDDDGKEEEVELDYDYVILSKSIP